MAKESDTSETFLKVTDISRSFGKKKVLRGATFSQPTGTIAGLIGPSGGGKSILLKRIGHIVRSDGGTVEFENSEHYSASLMFQEGALFDSLSVLDNVAFPLVNGKVPVTTLSSPIREEVCEKAVNILGRVGLGNAINKMPGQLSGGMRRRASLARAMVACPKLLLLDDPTAGLDPVASSVIMNLIVDYHKEHKPTLLIVSHDLRRLLPIVDIVYCLFDGRIVFSGKVSELTTADSSVKEFVSCRYDFNDHHSVQSSI